MEPEVAMTFDNYHLARLEDSGVSSLHQFEKEIGKIAIAFEPDAPLARLEREQLARLRALEEQLGKVIVVYESA
jgi:division protein CdvB (Snf7/Vps24/ESCRT-III family)